MITTSERQELESDDIGGEVLSERDLVDADDFGFALPDGVNQEWLLGELWKDLIRGEHAKAVLVEAQMRRVIDASAQFDHQFVEGLGQVQCRIPMEVYYHWIAREGSDFWRQQSNLQYFDKRNPGFLIKTTHKKSIHVVDGFRDRTLSAPAESLGGQLLPAATASGRPELLGEHGAGKGAAVGVKTTPAVASPRGSRGGRWARA
ncbi:MAG: hypothetical protein WC205_04255 [Opitutaceae bacterium]|jgi:hypothetical protein